MKPCPWLWPTGKVMSSVGDVAGGTELCMSTGAHQQGQVCADGSPTAGATLLSPRWSHPDFCMETELTVLTGRGGEEQYHHHDHRRSATCGLAARARAV